MTDGFKEFKETEHLRLCTATRFSNGKYETVCPEQKLSIELKMDSANNDDIYYITISYIIWTGYEFLAEHVEDRYFKHIKGNKQLEAEFSLLYKEAQSIIKYRYCKSPEETVESIEAFIEEL